MLKRTVNIFIDPQASAWPGGWQSVPLTLCCIDMELAWKNIYIPCEKHSTLPCLKTKTKSNYRENQVSGLKRVHCNCETHGEQLQTRGKSKRDEDRREWVRRIDKCPKKGIILVLSGLCSTSCTDRDTETETLTASPAARSWPFFLSHGCCGNFHGAQGES